MYLCYIDESGTPDIPGTSSHFVLAGISIPIARWKYCDKAIEELKEKYELSNIEIHVGWLLRKYSEQRKISNFDTLSSQQRRARVMQIRTAELLRLQREQKHKQLKQTKKTYSQTLNYIHLTYQQRKDFITEVATLVSRWNFARLFAECIDKVYYNPSIAGESVNDQAFVQVISRFEHFLQNIGRNDPSCCGLLIHDNNETIALRHTNMMKKFHLDGTMWTSIKKIIETPLFVNSQLTSMVQIADLCAYALRRYVENGERELFDLIIHRCDSRSRARVGVRHYTISGCTCEICNKHRMTFAPATSTGHT